MKLKFAIVGLAALFSLAAGGSASALPLAPLSPASNVENIAVVCGPNGCIRRPPVYRPYAYGYRGGYGYRRGYGYRGGYRYRGYGVHGHGHGHRGYGVHGGYRRR
ncbi:hypothetical protein [Nitrobacter sp.]|uniref:hypothetical protein n=1 Tax=Nitrobacter sp. TaxID=29420 RepID=UPI001D67E444|nr:hypothetical protein [Nitrobacter sp.]MCB1393015.1 hypothetical protein [Nitrobacter sp.]